MFSKLIFNCPWYYVIICLACGAIFSGFLYFKNKRNTDVSNNILIILTGLRFLSCTLIAFLLLNIFIKQLKNETQTPTILLAIDNSQSIVAAQDSNFIRKEFIKNLDDVKNNINKNYTLKTILFGAQTITGDAKPDFRDKETDIDNLIGEVENNYSNQNVGALIIVSDGIYNKGSNPLYNTEKLNFPIYTIALGDTNELQDISVQKINHNQFAYSGNAFPAEVIINAKKYKGKEVTVSLTDARGKKLSQKISINSDNFLSTVTFTLNADFPGVQRYAVNINALEGEKNISNNYQSFVVEVIDNRSKILILANYPHPDVSAIKEALLTNGNYEVDYSLIGDFKKPLKQYSLVILHGYSASNTQLANECKTNLIPVWLVNPASAENLPGIKIASSFNKQNDAEASFNNSFGLFTISDELKKFIKDLPALKTFFGNYSLSNGANSIINQKIGTVETDNPILIFTETNGLKSSVFVGDGMWRWKMRDFYEHKNNNLFNELLSKIIQYLTVKSDKSFFRITSPKIVNENEMLELGAEVYNKAYELVNDADVQLTLTNSNKKQFNYTFSKTSNAYKLNLGFLAPGEYKYEAKVKIGSELYVKNGSILVKEIMAEKINTIANHQLLFQLSYRTGGKLFYPKQLNKLSEEIAKNQLIKPITYSTNLTTSILDLKWILFGILILLSLEWFLRKRYLTI
ncbi:MAG: hypothetical protein HYX39_03380 [Bacteroidetes bacterium]|nr:hypothetical protein [Bacteroidota bacterium]